MKTTLRFHLTPVRVTKTNKTTNNKRWNKLTLIHYCFIHYGKGCEGFSKRLKINLLYDLVILILGIFPTDSTQYCTVAYSAMFIAALFMIAKKQKQAKHPSPDEWIMKMWCINTMEYYPAVMKN